MVHSRIRSSHRIAVNYWHVEMNAGREGAHSISAAAGMVSFLLDEARSYLHLVNKHALKRRDAEDLVYGLDAHGNLVASSNPFVDDTRAAVP